MFVMEGAVTSAVYQAIAVAAWLYEQARFHGPVDIGIAALGIEAAGAAARAKSHMPAPVFGAPDYRRHDRVTAEELRGGLDDLVRRLLAPLFEVISVRDYDPLGGRTER